MNDSNHQFDEKFLNSINFIHEVKIYNEIQNDQKILIFDLRKREDFDKSHLDLSVNIPHNEFEENFFENIDEKIISEMTKDKTLSENILKYKRFYLVIIISQNKIHRKNIFLQTSQNKEEVDIINKSLIFYKAFIKNRVRELGFYNHGFNKLVGYYPFLIRNSLFPPIVQ
jgi:rhodanese-related sulfurtransferase